MYSGNWVQGHENQRFSLSLISESGTDQVANSARHTLCIWPPLRSYIQGTGKCDMLCFVVLSGTVPNIGPDLDGAGLLLKRENP